LNDRFDSFRRVECVYALSALSALIRRADATVPSIDSCCRVKSVRPVRYAYPFSYVYHFDAVRRADATVPSIDSFADFLRHFPTIESDDVSVGFRIVGSRTWSNGAPISELPSTDPINDGFRRRRKFHHRVRQNRYCWSNSEIT